MKADLQQRVTRWTNPSTLLEARSCTEQQSHGVYQELLLTLRIELRLTVGTLTEVISKHQVFHTLQNGSQEDESSGDCYRFERVSNSFTEEFFEEYESTLKRMIDDQYGNGFVNPE